MRVRRSDSFPMSLTNSRIVSASISFCKMESDRSLMEASGVLSSCDASDTNCRCVASDSCKRSVSLLNSVASVVYSSSPRIWILWLYSPSRTRRMDMRILRMRLELTTEKIAEHATMPPSKIHDPRRMFRSRFSMISPCSASKSITYTQPIGVARDMIGTAAKLCSAPA